VSGQTADFFLDRHASADWGDVCPEDWQLNDQAIKDGSRILSACRRMFEDNSISQWAVDDWIVRNLDAEVWPDFDMV
jgi:hypothetical protein